MKPLHRIAAVAALLIAVPATALGLHGVPPFQELEGFPAPAENAFGVTADALKDGRFIAYDGNSVFVQERRGSGTFNPIATGYPGDPGFISVSPNGRLALLGAGFLGEVWVLDLDAPVDAAEPLTVLEGNFSAAWLTDDRIVVNRATQPDPNEFIFEAELGILDLGVVPFAYQVAVTPAGGASADVAVGPFGKRLYTTDGITGETRFFSVASLLAAVENAEPLSWEDGELLGVYNTGGPLGVTPDGRRILIGGADPVEFLGFVQVVDTWTGEVIEEINPSGDPGTFSSGAITRVTGRILLVGTAFPGPEVTAFESVRGYGGSGLPVLWNLIFLQVFQSIQAFFASLFGFLH